VYVMRFGNLHTDDRIYSAVMATSKQLASTASTDQRLVDVGQIHLENIAGSLSVFN